MVLSGFWGLILGAIDKADVTVKEEINSSPIS